MRKFMYILFITFSFFGLIGLVSCSNDSDDASSTDDNILGEWNIVSDDAEIFGEGSLIFKNNGVMIWNYVDTKNPNHSRIKDNNTYVIAGNTLQMDINIQKTGDVDATAKGTLNFSGNKAVYVYRWNENSGKGWSEDEYTLTLSKK